MAGCVQGLTEHPRPFAESRLPRARRHRPRYTAPPSSVAATAPIIFFKEVAQNRPPHFLARTSLSTRNRFTPNFQGWGLDENLKLKSPPYPGGQARRKKLLLSWGPLIIAPPLGGSLFAPLKCATPCGDRGCCETKRTVGRTRHAAAWRNALRLNPRGPSAQLLTLQDRAASALTNPYELPLRLSAATS